MIRALGLSFANGFPRGLTTHARPRPRTAPKDLSALPHRISVPVDFTHPRLHLGSPADDRLSRRPAPGHLAHAVAVEQLDLHDQRLGKPCGHDAALGPLGQYELAAQERPPALHVPGG